MVNRLAMGSSWPGIRPAQAERDQTYTGLRTHVLYRDGAVERFDSRRGGREPLGVRVRVPLRPNWHIVYIFLLQPGFEPPRPHFLSHLFHIFSPAQIRRISTQISHTFFRASAAQISLKRCTFIGLGQLSTAASDEFIGHEGGAQDQQGAE